MVKKISTFWDIMPRSLIKVNQQWRNTSPPSSVLKSKPNKKLAQLCQLAYILVYNLTLKIELIYFIYFSETADIHWTTWHFTPEDRALQDRTIFRMQWL
jgi:hypothetical protein